METRFRGDKRASKRFLAGEDTPNTNTARSSPSVEWRLLVESNVRAAAAQAPRGGPGVAAVDAAVWRTAMAE